MKIQHTHSGACNIINKEVIVKCTVIGASLNKSHTMDNPWIFVGRRGAK